MRKEKTIHIEAEGRDQGKVFHLKEMPAAQAERWATRALLALLKSGVEIPDDIAEAGLAGVAALGLKAFGGLDYADAEPLLAEMLGCISFLPNPSQPAVIMPYPVWQDQVEEVATLLKLRIEVFQLHVGFSLPGVGSKSTSTTGTANPGSTTPTSRARSAR